MGSILKASCRCGYEADGILQGLGFGFGLDGTFYEPAYCDHCGRVEARDGRSENAVCEYCQGRLHVYREEAAQPVILNEGGFPETDYFEKQDWHCPQCKQQALRYTQTGLWD